MDVIVAIMPLVAGYCLDLSLGDPLWLPHPVVGFGHMISACERRLNRGGHRVAKGAFTVIPVWLISSEFCGTGHATSAVDKVMGREYGVPSERCHVSPLSDERA